MQSIRLMFDTNMLEFGPSNLFLQDIDQSTFDIRMSIIERSCSPIRDVE